MLNLLNNILVVVTGSVTKRVQLFLRTILIIALFSITAYAQTEQWNELNSQISILCEKGAYSEVLVIAEKALNVAKETYGADHHNSATSMDNLANVFIHLGKFKEAEALFN